MMDIGPTIGSGWLINTLPIESKPALQGGENETDEDAACTRTGVL